MFQDVSASLGRTILALPFRRALMVLAACLCTGTTIPTIAQVALTQDTTAQDQMAFLGVRVLKVPGAGNLEWSAELPGDCPGCRLVLNDYAAGQNDKEVFFHVWVPTGGRSHGPFRVKVDPTKVRGILVSYTDTELGKRGYATDRPRVFGLDRVAYASAANSISFSVPAELKGVSMPPDDLGEVSQYYTYIETPGVYIRVGHADQQRRAGPYATGPWPAKQAAAALNLEFAAREAIGALQLEKSLPKLGVSTIMLMNFDTNYPTLGPDEAHEDWPPHWHMHLFWKDVPKVRKVAHFYLSEDALLTGDFSSDLKGSSLTERAKRWYPNGVLNETRTPSGELVYSQTITAEGYFKLGTANGACLISPVSGGFDSGAKVTCDNGTKPVSIRATDNPAIGILMLYRNEQPETEYRYDTDTGAITATRTLAH